MKIFSVLVFLLSDVYSQDAFDLMGNLNNKNNSQFRLNSLEGNISGFNRIKDWELSLSYGGVMNNNIYTNIYQIAISKKSGGHNFYARYSPGISQDFLVKSGANLTIGDTAQTQLNLSKKFTYEERFGFNYSYNFDNNFTIGTTIRYFYQSFSSEELVTFFSDTLNYLTTETLNDKYERWRFDFGVKYIINEKVNFGIGTANLFNFIQKNEHAENNKYRMRNQRDVIVDLNYSPSNYFNFSFFYQSNNSMSASLNTSFFWGSSSFTLGASLFHLNNKGPFIDGIIPGINYSGEIFSLSLTGVKYFGKNTSYVEEFETNGISNILHNNYSNDRIILTLNLSLSFEQKDFVRFVNYEILEPIYPSLYERYLDIPFAKATIENISDENIVVKPVSFIKEINNEHIFSPQISIDAGEQKEIYFYTIIDRTDLKIEKTKISQAELFLQISDDDYDDYIQSPILIHNPNAWNGEISNLKYFVKSEYEFSLNYAKKILADNKNILDTLDNDLINFYQTKILFDKFSQSITYVSDPRSSTERVQFPSETLELKGGDCDDLSVAFASILQSIGIECAFVDFKDNDLSRHVNLIVNMKLSPEKSYLLTINDKKYLLRKNNLGEDKVWIFLETTELSGFIKAWEVGSKKFYDEAIKNGGLDSGRVNLVDIY